MALPDKARAVSAVYALIGDGRVRTNAGRVMRLIEAVAKGPPASRIAVSERRAGLGTGGGRYARCLSGPIPAGEAPGRSRPFVQSASGGFCC